MITKLNDRGFKNQIIDFDLGRDANYKVTRNTILELYRDECPHCVSMLPILEEASDEFPDIDFYKIDVETHPEIASLYDIAGTPTFIRIPVKSKKPVMAVGEMSLDDFRDFINGKLR